MKTETYFIKKDSLSVFFIKVPGLLAVKGSFHEIWGMKGKLHILKMTVCLAAMITAGQTTASGQDYAEFDKLYDQTDFVYNYASKVFYGTVTPVWKSNTVFGYSTRGASGNEWYLVDIEKGTRIQVPEDSVTVQAARTQSMGQGAWNGAPMGGFRGRPQGANSPDGKWECLIRDNNIWLRSADGRELTQLSFDGNNDYPYIMYQWSPDSRFISAMKREKHEYRQVLLRDSRPDTQVQPDYRWLDYDKPGDRLPQSEPALFSVENKAQIEFPTDKWQNQYEMSLGRWAQDSRYFTFDYNQRGHQLYQVVAVDTDGSTRIIAEEKSSTFVYYNDLYRHYMKDGKSMLWISERDDWRHLYSIDLQTSQTVQLTKGEWNVREILHIDEEQGIILFYASGFAAKKGEDPYNKHLLRLDLKKGTVKDLTPDNGFHTVTFNSDHSYFVDNWSRPDRAPESVVRSSTDGKVMVKLQKADITELLKAGFTMPEVFSAKGRDGKTDIWGNIYRPSNFDPKKNYPVVEYIYSGPHDSFVDKEFMTYVRFSRLVEMGFIVVTIDGMGTDNRSKSFQDVAFRNLKDAGLPDHILWIKAASRKYRYMDTSNMGIYGYSAGGQNALSALLFQGDFYKVAVALCGCHDNRMDKIWWNEQWMGWPVGPWYSENSNVDNAYRLEGKLFLINGEMDDNVDPASTLQVVAELVRNGKDFEQLYLPEHTHNLGSEYITRRVFRFFYKNCVK